jgi:hypothetical protein
MTYLDIGMRARVIRPVVGHESLQGAASTLGRQRVGLHGWADNPRAAKCSRIDPLVEPQVRAGLRVPARRRTRFTRSR